MLPSYIMIINNQTLGTNAIGRNYTLIRVMHVSAANRMQRERKNAYNDRLYFSIGFAYFNHFSGRRL